MTNCQEDLHDHNKAMTATRRMPVQLVREDKASLGKVDADPKCNSAFRTSLSM